MTSYVITRLSFNLTQWPIYKPKMTCIQLWLDKTCKSLRQNIQEKFKKDEVVTMTMRALRYKGFLKIWLTELVFDPRWLIIKFDLNIIQVSILTKFVEDKIKKTVITTLHVVLIMISFGFFFMVTWFLQSMINIQAGRVHYYAPLWRRGGILFC